MSRLFSLTLAVLIINISVNVASMQTFTLNEYTVFNTTINCIEKIVKKTLSFKPTVVYLTVSEDISTDKNIFSDELIEKLSVKKIPLIILERDENIPEKSDILKTDLLIIQFYDNCNKITNLMIKHKEAKYLNIINSNETKKCLLKIQQIGEKFVTNDVSFLLKDTIVTIMPFIDGSHCKESVNYAIKINHCYDDTAKTIGFPSKDLADLHKCPLRAGLRTLYPYVMKNMTKILKEHDKLTDATGFDVEIIKILSYYFNGRLELYYINLGENAISHLDFVQFLVNGSLDIAAGGLYRIYGNAVEYSGVYSKQTAVWAYYVERVNRSWQNLIKNVDGCPLFLIFLFIYSAIWYCMSMFDKKPVHIIHTLLSAFGALVGASSLQNAKSTKHKLLNLAYLILCMHVAVYINIQLYSFLTVSAPPAGYKTNEDIILSGKTLFLNSSTRITEDERYLTFMNTSRPCLTALDCFTKALSNKGITALLDSYFMNFQAATAVNDEARMVKTIEDIRDISHEMVLRKNSLIVKPIQKVLQWLIESGITKKLFTDALGLSVVGKAELANQKIINNSYSCGTGCEISLSQLAGVFYVWMLGCGLSVCVFIIEMIWKKQRESSRIE